MTILLWLFFKNTECRFIKKKIWTMSSICISVVVLTMPPQTLTKKHFFRDLYYVSSQYKEKTHFPTNLFFIKTIISIVIFHTYQCSYNTHIISHYNIYHYVCSTEIWFLKQFLKSEVNASEKLANLRLYTNRDYRLMKIILINL